MKPIVKCAAFAVFSLTRLPVAGAQAPTFVNKTVTVLIGSGPAGGFDTYGRLFAQFLGSHLPGHPSILVRNMPGAGSLVAVNYIYNVAPRDGSEIAVVGQVAAMNQVLRRPGVHYDVRKLTWVGRLTSNTPVLFTWYKSGIKTIKDALTHQVVMAGTSAASLSVIIPHMMNDFLGTKFKVVRGYRDSGSAILALERGEAEAAGQPWNEIKATHSDWLREKKINLIVLFSMKRNPQIPWVPAVAELARNTQQRQLLSVFVSGGDVGYPIVAPPNLAPPVVATLRKAFEGVMKDPKFVAAARRENLTLAPLPGAELQKINDDELNVPNNIIEEARKYISTN